VNASKTDVVNLIKIIFHIKLLLPCAVANPALAPIRVRRAVNVTVFANKACDFAAGAVRHANTTTHATTETAAELSVTVAAVVTVAVNLVC